MSFFVFNITQNTMTRLSASSGNTADPDTGEVAYPNLHESEKVLVTEAGDVVEIASIERDVNETGKYTGYADTPLTVPKEINTSDGLGYDEDTDSGMDELGEATMKEAGESQDQ